MIDIAARATHGITIPNRKATRKYIIELFKKNLTDLRNRLAVNFAHINSLQASNYLFLDGQDRIS